MIKSFIAGLARVTAICIGLAGATVLSGCMGNNPNGPGVSAASAETPVVRQASRQWFGMLAVQESPLVNQIVRESGNDPRVYYPLLRAALDAGQIAPAPGRYCMQPYRNGRRYESEECMNIQTGIWSRWGPSQFVGEGRAMCIKVPASWPAIAGQRQYPASGGYRYNCFDFTNADNFPTRERAAMVVVIAAAN